MITVRYVGDEAREVSILPHGTLKLVQPDETFDVLDEFAESYACQPHFYDVPGYTPITPQTADPNTPDPDLDDPADPNPDPDPKPADKTTTKKAGN